MDDGRKRKSPKGTADSSPWLTPGKAAHGNPKPTKWATENNLEPLQDDSLSPTSWACRLGRLNPRLTPGATIYRPLRGLCLSPSAAYCLQLSNAWPLTPNPWPTL